MLLEVLQALAIVVVAGASGMIGFLLGYLAGLWRRPPAEPDEPDERPETPSRAGVRDSDVSTLDRAFGTSGTDPESFTERPLTDKELKAVEERLAARKATSEDTVVLLAEIRRLKRPGPGADTPGNR